MLHEQLETLAKEKIYEKNFIQLEKIGQGGFASVYRVVHRIDDAQYAVKQIHLKIREVKDDLQKHYEKLIREAKYLAQVNHPNVIRYYQSWVQVTEKKKHQKQAEQKRQAMELSSTSFSKKHPSKENSFKQQSQQQKQQYEKQIEEEKKKKTSAHQQTTAANKESMPQKEVSQHIEGKRLESVKSGTAVVSNNNNDARQQNESAKRASQNLISQPTPKSKKQSAYNNNNNNKHSFRHQSSQESNEKASNADSNEQPRNQKQKQTGHRRAFIEKEEEQNTNEDNTFYFDYDNDNEVVFVEDDNSKSLDDEDEEDFDSQEEEDDGDDDDDDNDGNEDDDEISMENDSEEQDSKQKRKLKNGSKGFKNNSRGNLGNTPSSSGANSSNIKKNKSRDVLSPQGISQQLQKSSLSQQQQQQSPQLSQNNKSILKNQSEFQLVFESIEDQNTEGFALGQASDLKNSVDLANSNDKQQDEEEEDDIGLRNNIRQKQVSLQAGQMYAAARRTDFSDKKPEIEPNVSKPHVQATPAAAAAVVSSTKSYERRKNKSMDYLTIGQKQRETQLDLYDEIIFYLQTELCSTTLAEYLANRNKKIFSTSAPTNNSSALQSNQQSSQQLSTQSTTTQSQQQQQQQQSQPAARVGTMLVAPIPIYKPGPMMLAAAAAAKKKTLSNAVSPSPDSLDPLSTEQKLEAIRILKEIIKGLWHIHHVCKMVHRDLKPHNIFLTENLQVKIGDFGLVKKLSKLINPSENVQYNDHKLPKKIGGVQQIITSITNSLSAVSTSPSENNSAVHDRLPFYLPKEEITSTCGTATYASPEQLSQKVEYFDHRADIYSLGIIILQLFHPMNTTMELVKSIQNCKKGDLPKQFCIRYPQLAEIIKDSLSNDPQKRPLLSTIENTLAEMEIIQGTLQSEDFGKLTLTFEEDQSTFIKYGKIMRHALYLYKNQNSEKAEYMYSLKECTINIRTASPPDFMETILITHPIQQNIILKALNNEKTQQMFNALKTHASFF